MSNATEWQEAAKKLIQETPVFGLLLAAHMVMPLRKKIDVSFTNIIHLFGPHSSGKSTVLQAATTLSGKDGFLLENDDFPFSVKHIDKNGWNEDDGIIEELYMEFGNNTVKDHHQRAQRIIRYSEGNGTIVSSGNGSLLSLCSKADLLVKAVDDRVLEIDCFKNRIFSFRDHQRVADYLDALRNTKGSFYPQVEAYTKANEKTLEEQYSKSFDHYVQYLNTKYCGRFTRKAATYALLECGLTVMADTLGVNKVHLVPVIALLASLTDQAINTSLYRIPTYGIVSFTDEEESHAAQHMALTFGMAPSELNIPVLVSLLDEFQPSVLEAVRPGLAMAVALVKDDDADTAERTLQTFMERAPATQRNDLPDDLAV